MLFVNVYSIRWDILLGWKMLTFLPLHFTVIRANTEKKLKLQFLHLL